jgi:anti-anti-sigma factor
MPISLKNQQGYSIILIDGKFNASSVSEVRKAAECAVGQGNKSLILDFSKTNALDSAGIGSLMALQKLCVGLGGKLYLVSVSAGILGLLKSCAAFKVLSILPVLFDAEALLTSGVVKQERGFYVLFKMPAEFNLATVKPLREAVEETKEKGYQHIVFDFERCRTITSVGIGLLVNLHKELADKNGGVHLLGISGEVLAVMQATHILSVLKTYKTLDEIDETLMPKPL